jgi:hypothetical protein
VDDDNGTAQFEVEVGKTRSSTGPTWPAIVALVIICATIVALCWITRTVPGN